MGAFRTETEHPWPDNTVVGGFFLVITNFILLFAIFYLLRIGHWDTAAVLTTLMLASTAYHSCRAGFVCLMRFRDAQVLDHLSVYAALLWVTSKCIVKNEWFSDEVRETYPDLVLRARVALFFLLSLPVSGFVLNNPESFWTNIFGFILPFVLILISSAWTGAPIFYQPLYGWIGIILFSASIVFYSLCPKTWYDTAHSIWHVLSMLSIPFFSVACDDPLRRQFSRKKFAEDLAK